jgi:four helix bundle protein
MKFQKFEDILGWQKGQDLAVLVYEHFSNNKDFDFRNQIRRASVSVSNNVAEGFDRGSNKDFTRFLYIARASASEVKSMYYLGKRLNLIDQTQFDLGINLSSEVNKILNGLINYLEKLDQSK